MTLNEMILKLQELQAQGHGNEECHIAFGDFHSSQAKQVCIGELWDDEGNEVLGDVVWFVGY